MEGVAGPQYNPHTVEAVFWEYKGRRAGSIKSLTADVEEFYQQRNPENENLCLYTYPGGSSEVTLPTGDSWLHFVSLYFTARFSFCRSERKRLFILINDLPIIFEVVTGFARKQETEKPSVSSHNNSKSGSKVRGSEPENQEEEEEVDAGDDERGPLFIYFFVSIFFSFIGFTGTIIILNQKFPFPITSNLRRLLIQIRVTKTLPLSLQTRVNPWGF